MSGDIILETRGLTKEFKGFVAVDRVDLKVRRGAMILCRFQGFVREALVVEGKIATPKDIKALATMPSKEELYSKLLFLISSPAQRLVTVMNAVGRNLAVVVDQGVQQKKFKEA